MPGKRSSPAWSRRRKLSRISCLTDLETQPLARSAARVVGRTESDFTRTSPGEDVRMRANSYSLIVGRPSALPLIFWSVAENRMRWQIPVGLVVLVLFLVALFGFVSKAYPPPPDKPKSEDPWLADYMP